MFSFANFKFKLLKVFLSLSLVLSFFPITESYGIELPFNFENGQNQISTLQDSEDLVSGDYACDATENGYLESESYEIVQNDDGTYSFSKRDNDTSPLANSKVSLASESNDESEELPTKVDLRERGLVSRVKNQHPYGTCWSMGSLAAAEISLANSLGIAQEGGINPINFSASHMVKFANTPLSTNSSELKGSAKFQAGEGCYDYNNWMVNGGLGSYGGSPSRAASLMMQGVGPISLDVVPYTNSKNINDNKITVSDSTRNYFNVRLKKFNEICGKVSGNEDSVKEIKKQINEGNGVACSYSSSSKYYNSSTCAQYTTATSVDHVVCIVGYDDNYSKDNFRSDLKPSKDGAFLVKNSWGGHYGNNQGDYDYGAYSGSDEGFGIDGSGFFWLSYYDCSLADCTTFEMDASSYEEDYTNNSKEIIDQYDYLQTTSNEPYVGGGSTGGYASIFTASENQIIHDVGTYYMTPNTTLTYKVYKLKTDAKTPDDVQESSEIVSGSYLGSCEGYVRLKLEKDIEVKVGEKYCVNFLQLDKRGCCIIPFGHDTNSSSKATVNSGESFRYSEYEQNHWVDWVDLVQRLKNYSYTLKWTVDNPCVKAYASALDRGGKSNVYFYDGDYSIIQTETITDGNYVTRPSNPKRAGYTFAGWYKDKECTQPFNFETGIINEDTDLFSGWIPNTYTIKFDGNGYDSGTSPKSLNMTYDVEQTLPTNTFTRTGYTFYGWSTTKTGEDGTIYQEGQSVKNLAESGEVTLYAYWRNVFNVSFVMNGHGVQVEKQMINYGEKIEDVKPTETGYTFNGWYTDKDLTKSFDVTTPIKNDYTLYAKWTVNTYKIEYELNGGENNSSNPDSYTFGVGVSSFAKPKKNSQAFQGWYSDSSFQNKVESISTIQTGDVKLYAKWTSNCCVVTFNGNGATSGEMATQELDTEIEDTLDACTFKRDKYVFTGWNTQADGKGTSYSDKATLTELSANSTLILYAQWRPFKNILKYFGNGSSSGSMEDQTVYYSLNNKLNKNGYIREGYTFKGWSYQTSGRGVDWHDQSVYRDYMFNNDSEVVKLYALWSPNTYTIKFNGNGADGGESITDLSMTYDTAQSLPSNTYTKTGYKFKGWSLSSSETTPTFTDTQSVNNLTSVNGDTVTLYAVWEEDVADPEPEPNPKTANYTVKHMRESLTADSYPESLTSIETLSGTVGEQTQAEAKTYTGFNTPSVEQKEIVESGETVVEIKYSRKSYSLKFDANGHGTDPATQTVKYEGLIQQQSSPMGVCGYAFSGWYKDLNTFQLLDFTAFKMPANDLVLYAKWIPYSYTIEFNGNGTDSNQLMSAMSMTYDVEKNLNANTFKREGYTFKGWSTSKSDLSVMYSDKQKVKNLVTENNGSITLYAVWEQNKLMMSRLYNQYTGEHFYTSNDSEKNGLIKIGWNDEGTGWVAPEESETPVYRLYNPHVSGGDHHYTTSKDEYDKLKTAGWRQEGIGWYSDDKKGVPLYRQYNPFAQTGTHNYTTSQSENDNLVKAGWEFEGTAWYGMK